MESLYKNTLRCPQWLHCHPTHTHTMTTLESMRLDKWLWCARFFKTRSLACEAVNKGRVTVNTMAAKPSREIRAGDTLVVQQEIVKRTVVVQGISPMRGPAPQAQLLYQETADSIAAREQAAEQRRLAPEPSASIRQGRPTKRDRRQLQSIPQTQGWGDRWSASITDE